MTDLAPLSGYNTVIADAQTLLRALPIEAGAVRSRRLYRTEELTILGVSIDAGAVLADHVSRLPILIQVVDGQMVLEVRPDRLDLSVGAMVHVEANVRHAVEALIPTRFLILQLGSAGSRRAAGAE